MNLTDLQKIRRDLHQIPELGYEEFKTQAYLLDYLSQLPQANMVVKQWRTGLLVRISGTDSKKTIGYRADMDGLPIVEETGLAYASKHLGKMHACGHDMHMTIALGVITNIVTAPLQNDVVFYFQPAEENPGGAQPMLASDEMKEWWPDQILALHVAPEYEVGKIALKPGLLFANTSELFVNFTGKGGHAAYPHKANDMVVAACEFVSQVQSIISRNIDPLDSAVITIGKVAAGNTMNIISETAAIEGTIRTLSKETMAIVNARIAQLIEGMSIAYDCKIERLERPAYMQVYNNEQVTKEFINHLEKQFPEAYVPCRESMTGEDFGYMLDEIPGLMFWLGIDTPYGLHHSKMSPTEEALPFAVGVITSYLKSLDK